MHLCMIPSHLMATSAYFDIPISTYLIAIQIFICQHSAMLGQFWAGIFLFWRSGPFQTFAQCLFQNLLIF